MHRTWCWARRAGRSCNALRGRGSRRRSGTSPRCVGVAVRVAQRGCSLALPAVASSWGPSDSACRGPQARLTFTTASQVAEELMKREPETVRIVFNKFQSAISFRPTIATALSGPMVRLPARAWRKVGSAEDGHSVTRIAPRPRPAAPGRAAVQGHDGQVRDRGAGGRAGAGAEPGRVPARHGALQRPLGEPDVGERLADAGHGELHQGAQGLLCGAAPASCGQQGNGEGRGGTLHIPSARRTRRR